MTEFEAYTKQVIEANLRHSWVELARFVQSCSRYTRLPDAEVRRALADRHAWATARCGGQPYRANWGMS